MTFLERWWLHPFLVAAFPVLYLVQRNAADVALGDAAVPLLLALALAALALALARTLLRDRARASLLASVLLLAFFSYGHLWELARGARVGPITIDRDLYVIPVWLLLFGALSVAAVRARARAADATRGLNGASLALVITSIVGILAAQLGKPSAAVERSTPAASGGGTTRDIYYLIFDRYGGDDSLREFFDIDNRPFFDALRQRGFAVAEDSRGNYPKTDHSLAASLNMGYLDDVTRRVGEDSGDFTALRPLLQDHAVGRFLKEQGYRYYHIGTYYDATANATRADVNVRFDDLSDLWVALYKTTAAAPVAERLGYDLRYAEAQRILFQFDAIASAPERPGPRFVFAHLLIPHGPYLFDERGRYRSLRETIGVGEKRLYRDQLLFANRKILETLDRILATPSGREAIVVLQADEGPNPRRIVPGGVNDWWRSPESELRLKFPILNAYRLPGEGTPDVYPTISPVNSFRLIFSRYFGADLSLLQDRSYIYYDSKHLYRFIDVTETVAPRD